MPDGAQPSLLEVQWVEFFKALIVVLLLFISFLGPVQSLAHTHLPSGSIEPAGKPVTHSLMWS